MKTEEKSEKINRILGIISAVIGMLVVSLESFRLSRLLR